jgi:surfeit locus 1 family protein
MAGEHEPGEGVQPSASRPRRRPALAFAMLALVVIFAALGTWQVQRLFWKLDLIAQVEARIHAPPVPIPSPAQWPTVSAETDAYRRVTVTGTFRHDQSALVQAVTELGAGYWVMTPLALAEGSTVLVNRGFVPANRRDAIPDGAEPGTATVTGLLRISEPGGAFLRSNDPEDDRWYSRDVAAIAASRGIMQVAPFFIDADATANPGGLPVGGLTVVRFRNSHLVYALTWYALAVMSAAGAWISRRGRLA